MTYPPEPWALAGRMDVSTFLVPTAALPATAWPAGHRPLSVGGRTPVGAAWVDYAPGGQLSYRELLVAAMVRQGRAVRPHVVSIWVDSADSRAGGRELWGIPKDLAGFGGGAWAGPTADGRVGDLTCTPQGADRPVATAAVRRGRALPGRWPVRFAVAQDPRVAAGGPGASARGALVSPVSARSTVGRSLLRWDVDPDGELGYLAGLRPTVSVTLHDFAMSFGTARRP